jgi:hypothetical protein
VSIARVIAQPRAQLGKALAEALLDPVNEIRPPLMIALAAGDPEAAAVAARVTEEHIIAPMARWLGGPNGRTRALKMAMLATGLVSYLRQLPLREVTAAEQQRIADWFAGAVQAIVDQTE